MKRRRKRTVKNETVSSSPFEFVSQLGLKTWFKANWKFLLLLALLVFVSYANSLGNAFVSDDLLAIKNNPEINKTSYFWPFVCFLRQFIQFSINKIFGLNPAFFRLVNILFHLGSAWLIYIILSILLKPPAPLFAASIFAVHPALVECVTWISGGLYSQYTFFGLLFLFFYILSPEKRKFYLLAIVSFILLLVSAERGVIFAGILVAWKFTLGTFSKNWKKTVPFFILAAIIIALTFIKVGARLTVLQTEFAQADTSTRPLLHIPIAVTSYFQMLFFPKDLTLFYTKTIFDHSEYVLRLMILIFYLGSIIYCYMRKHRFIFFWLSFFIIALLPVLTPLRVASLMAERYVYTASIGIFVLVALAFRGISKAQRLKIPVYIVFSLIIIALSARTIIRNIDWKDEEHLWRAALKVAPDGVNAINNLGDIYLQKGDLENAADQFKKAIELRPDWGDPYNNLGLIHYLTGKKKEAIENYQKAISLNPYFWQSYDGLAVIYFEQKKYDLAKESIVEAIKIKPNMSLLHTNLGIIYLEFGEKEKAIEEFEKALEIDPNWEQAKKLLGFVRSGINIKVQNLDY